MKRMTIAPTFALALAIAPAAAEDWPSWRGPRGDGTSRETNVPIRWNATENVAWKTPVPGTGHSSPVVIGDRVFLTSYLPEGDKRCLFCIDRRTGKITWERVVLTSPPERKHRYNSHASSTPASDGRHICVPFLKTPEIWLVCYDLDGKEIWRTSPGTFKSVHGFCSSPLLHRDLVILNCDQDDVAFIVAFDRATGKERWRADRPNRTRSYCAPLVVEAAAKTQMVLSGSKCVASYDPATGKQHWIIDGPTEQFVASPVYAEGLFFITGGYPQHHFMAIRPDGTGNVTHSHVAWHDNGDPKAVSYVPSPIASGKYLFIVSDGGVASCREAKTGKPIWREPLGRHHWPSPVSANNRLYFLDDDGNTFVLDAAPKFRLIEKNPLGEECYASPAISGGQIFIRTMTNLWCLGVASDR